jgi:hypothetical protein
VSEQIPFIRAQLCEAAEKMRVRFAPIEAHTTHLASTARITLKPATNAFAAAAPLKAGDPASDAVLFDFIDRQVLPYLRAGDSNRRRLGNRRYSEDIFRMVKLRVAPEYSPHIEEIQAWCDQRRMLDVQTRLQHWLHGWLFIHVPLSYLLIFMTAWHAFVTLFRY